MIIGAGGIGQYLAPALFKLLLYHPRGTDQLVLADGDNYQAHNNSRQFVSTVGENKAVALARSLPPSVQVIDKFINGANALKYLSYLDTPALIVPAVDNLATRKLVLETLDRLELDYIWLSPGNEYSTYMCSFYIPNKGMIHPLDRYPNLKDPKDVIPGGCIEEHPSTPQLIAANLQAAAAAVTLVTNYLDNADALPATVIGDIKTNQSTGQAYYGL